jgi:hypothetical protein
MTSDDVYVLGAGASFVHGAPLTDQLLPYALALSADRNDQRLGLVRQFLRDVFHFTVPDKRGRRRATPRRTANTDGRPRLGAAWSGMPGLVDVLSVVDMALDRKESLARAYDIPRLRQVRRALEFAIFTALEDSLRWRGPKERRSRATQALADRLDPERAVVISLNYDVIADIALAMRGRAFKFDRADVEILSAGDHQAIDYGIEFANVPPVTRQRRFQLLKLHGSFNWLQSRLTGNLYFGGMQKAIGILFRTHAERDAANLRSFFQAKAGQLRIGESIADLDPVMITPTHLKDLRNPHLARVWRRAEECLRGARRITFIGYSLPGDDLHVKYLFKRALQTRAAGAPLPRIVVVGKGPARYSQMRANYEHFFGKELVRYHGEGFDAWSRRPFGRAARVRRVGRVSLDISDTKGRSRHILRPSRACAVGQSPSGSIRDLPHRPSRSHVGV